MDTKGKFVEKAVEEALLKDKNRILNTIVSEMVEVEVNNRVKILKNALELEETVNKELQKVLETKPKYMFSADGSTKTPYYDESYISKKESLTANLNALNKAISLCIDSNTTDSYKSLSNIVGKTKI